MTPIDPTPTGDRFYDDEEYTPYDNPVAGVFVVIVGFMTLTIIGAVVFCLFKLMGA
jgi:hypothetical protein